MNIVSWIIGITLTIQQVSYAHGDALEKYNVPTFAVSDLENGKRDKEVKEVLESSGLLGIRMKINDNVNLKSLCNCHEMFDKIPGGNRVILDDNLTIRSTIATATMGINQPLSLPRKEISNLCNSDVYKEMEDVRDLVSQASFDSFIPTLDRLISKYSNKESLMKHENGQSYHSVQSIVDDAVHLEHYHVYDKKLQDLNKSKESNEAFPVDKALNWHTDAGLFLAFLPGQSCETNKDYDDDDDDNSLRIMVKNSQSTNQNEIEMITKFPIADSGEIIVAIMLGTGAENWLQIKSKKDESLLKLRATKHAVKMKKGDKRVWYGMMYLVSPKAIVQTSPKKYSFAEMRNSLSIHSKDRKYGDHHQTQKDHHISIGCGTTQSPMMIDINQSSIHRRRRLQHGVDPSDCTNNAQGIDFYCWMQCPTLDNDDLTVQQHLDQGESLYCAHLEELAETKDLKKAVQACTDDEGVVGGVMDSGCTNIWHPTVDGAFTYIEQEEENIHHLDIYQEKYCYGYTSMYMQGFEWEGSTCIVYLFQSWVITTRAAFIAACFGTIVFGIIVELFIKLRRTTTEKVTHAKYKLATSAILYGIQITLGYFIMLVVMTYSGPLVLSVVMGLVLGHVICNWELTSSDSSTNVHLSNSTTPCCVVEKDISKPISEKVVIAEQARPTKDIDDCCNC